MDRHVVIMAGGIGSRFWPMSTPEHPKQFIDVLGCGRTLIQMTADRLLPLCPYENMWVVTSRNYIDIVREQLPGIPGANILAEPEARNTAPCIAYACWKIKARNPGANIVVTPSDALVLDTDEYRRVISLALDFTAADGTIVTVGIKPSRPETGYGYILAGEEAAPEIFSVKAFKEKPDLATARAYLADGHYLWNAGIFVWNVSTITSALRTYAPGIASIMDMMAPSFYTPQEEGTVGRLFPLCEKISIDYAVMEKASGIHTIPASFGWSDLGSWGSLRLNSSTDGSGNATLGTDIHMFECEGCVVRTSSLKKVVLQGLSDYIVAEKDGSLLVCRLSEEQRIKDFSK
jgi:mannose-1-phosphate guanylyltransferase